MDFLQNPWVPPWLLAALGALLAFLLVLAFRPRGRDRQKRGVEASPTGLPDAPEGWEPLDRGARDELVKAVDRQGPQQARYYRAELSTGVPVALGYIPRQPWVDLYLPRKRPNDEPGKPTGPYEAYSFHIREGRWSFQAVPENRKELERMIRDAFRDYMAVGGRR